MNKTPGQIHFEHETEGYGFFWDEQDADNKEKHEQVAAAVIAHVRPQIEAEARGAFKDAVVDALVVGCIYTDEHDSNPRKAVSDLIAWETTIALDPSVSSDAAKLVASARAAAVDEDVIALERLRAALQRIACWYGEFPSTGKYWDEEKTLPMGYDAAYGSNGERDFMRKVARDALTPNVLPSGFVVVPVEPTDAMKQAGKKAMFGGAFESEEQDAETGARSCVSRIESLKD